MAKRRGFTSVLRAIVANGRLRRSSLGFGGCFTDPRYADGDFFDWFLRTDPVVAEGHRRAQLALIRNLDLAFVDSLSAVHARIAAPVRCIWGRTIRSSLIRLKARAMLGQFAGGAELFAIPGRSCSRTRIIRRNSSRTRFPFLLR